MVTIREATLEDIPDLVYLEERVFDTDRINAASFRNYIRNTRGTRIATVIAKDNTKLLGYYVLYLSYTVTSTRLYSLAVAKEYQGKGFGLLLLKNAEKRTRSAGKEYLRLEVKVSNTKAIDFYRKLGYTEYARQLGFYEDGSVAIKMKKQLWIK